MVSVLMYGNQYLPVGFQQPQKTLFALIETDFNLQQTMNGLKT